MGHGYYQDLVARDLVNDPVWKPLCSTPASSFGKLCPGFGVSQYPSDRVSDFLGEVITQSKLLFIVVLDFFLQFNLSRFKELIVFISSS
jgi:hypothetical protein